jgi:hypothetical protein
VFRLRASKLDLLCLHLADDHACRGSRLI